MLDIRYTIGRKEGTSACTFSYPILPYAGHLVTVIGNIVAGLDKPLDSGWAKQVAIRHRAASVLSILSVIFAVIGIPLGLFLLGGETLYDPLYLLFFERSIGALLVWIGVISGLFSLYLRWHGEGEGLRVPSRPRGEELPELPLDIASYILKVLPITEPVAIEGILTERTRFVLAQAVLLAQSEGKLLRSVHIVQSIINSEEGQAFCRRAGISPSSIELRLAGLQSPKTPSPGRICDEQSYVLIHRAFLTAYSSRHAFVTPLELLLTCIEADEDIQEVFLDLALDPKDAGHIVAWVHFEEALRERMSIVGMLVFYKKTGHMNIAMTACPTPTLDKLTTELTALAQKGDTTPLLGRDDVLDQVFSTLSSNLGNVLLVGDPGCGKSELLRGIAQLMASEDVPQMLQDKRFLRLDPGSLIAGAEGVGGIEGRLKSVINETVRAGNVFLAIEDIHHLLGASSTGSSEDAGAMLMNALSEGALKLIATTTAQEFAQYIQPRPAFLRRFQIVHIQEMGREDTLRVLEAASLNMESRYGVTVSFAALTTTYDLCDQLMPDRHFPDKAIRILEQSCAYARSVRGSGTIVGKEHVAKVIEQRTTVVVTDPNASERKSLLSIEEHLRRRVVGQDDAVKTVASAMRRARTGMRKGSRPQAVLLFLGPTGVGKTETAKAIAALSFGGEDRMIRLDLSEYQTPESLEKLLGKSGVTSVFCDAVRRYPAHLLLLDEFEKAHPDVLNIFLQIFEDGRLTDGRGQTLNFAHAFVIATSNVGSSKVYKGLSEGKPIEEIRKEVIDIELPRAMRPELINRFDKVVFFRPLSIQNMIPIVQLQLAPLRQALDQRGVRFEIAETAVEEFARRGYDPTFGARGLRRLLQDTLEEEVSRILLEGDVHRRDTIVVSQGGVISVQRAAKLQ